MSHAAAETEQQLVTFDFYKLTFISNHFVLYSSEEVFRYKHCSSLLSVIPHFFFVYRAIDYRLVLRFKVMPFHRHVIVNFILF